MDPSAFRRVDYLRVEVGAGGVRQVFVLRTPELEDGAGVEVRAELQLGGSGGAVETLGVVMAEQFGLPLRSDVAEWGSRSVLTLDVRSDCVEVWAPEAYESGG